MYLELESLLRVVEELERRGWLNKRWKTRKGPERGGKPFTRTSLHKLITNPVYIGKVKYKEERHVGEHAGIVDPVIWQLVQSILERNRRSGGAPVRNNLGAILKGILRCVPCACKMTPSHTYKGNRRYRYYLCVNAQRRGWKNCQSPSVPAQQIEQLVINQIKALGQDPKFLREIVAQDRLQEDAQTNELETQQRELEMNLKNWHREMRTLATQMKAGSDNGSLIGRLADLQERIATTEETARKIKDQARTVGRQLLDVEEASLAMTVFDPAWGALTPKEQARVVELLVERVDFEGAKGKVSIAFRSTGDQNPG